MPGTTGREMKGFRVREVRHKFVGPPLRLSRRAPGLMGDGG